MAGLLGIGMFATPNILIGILNFSVIFDDISEPIPKKSTLSDNDRIFSSVIPPSATTGISIISLHHANNSGSTCFPSPKAEAETAAVVVAETKVAQVAAVTLAARCLMISLNSGSPH